MNKIIYIILIMLITSCSYGFNTTTDCKDLESLCYYVNEEIDYLYDWDSVYDTKEYFQSPIETHLLKTGDCEDFSVYFMYLAKKELNIKPDFTVFYISGMGYHAMCNSDGVYYDPTNNIIFYILPVSFKKIVSFTYDEIMLYATGFYTKGIYE